MKPNPVPRRSHIIEGTLHVSERIARVDLMDAVREFEGRHPGVRIEVIDDREVVGACEACDRPFFDGDDYVSYEEGIFTCRGECA